MKGHNMARHHHSKHHGAHHGKKHHSEHEHYAGMDSRRHQEMSDAGMIHEDHHAVANMPQEVMMKFYPKTGPNMPEDLDDTLRGVDSQMDHDDSQRRRGFAPKKV